MIVAASVTVGCGDGGGSTLADADEALASLRSARITLAMTSTASGDDEATEPVGFALEGSYDLDAGSTFPVLDLTYTRLLGGEEQVLQFRSDGDTLVAGPEGELVEVPPEQAGPLRRSDDTSAGVVDGLGIEGWVEDASEEDGPEVDGTATRLITGAVDVADLLADLAVLTSQVAGAPGIEPVDEGAADRLRELVRSSSIEVLVGRADDVPRRLAASVAFGTEVADELRGALGPYAGVTLDVELTVDAPGEPVPVPALDA